jgi:hypothetical protein
MIDHKAYICLIPVSYWSANVDSDDAAIWYRAAQDALEAERRIGEKGVNLQANYALYMQACRFVEGAAISKLTECSLDEMEGVLGLGRTPAITFDANSYLEVIDFLREQAGSIRLGSTIFPPDQVSGHVAGFAKLCPAQYALSVQPRVQAFHKAAELDCGIVEVISPWRQAQEQTKRAPRVDVHTLPSLKPIGVEDLGVPLDGVRRELMERSLRAAMALALREDGQAWNFSNTPHEIIAEVLYDFAYREPNSTQRLSSIGVLYADGSQGQPLPLGCLDRVDPAQIVQDCKKSMFLRVALISMRHLALDAEVDMAWYRNIEASQSRKLADTDNVCTELAERRFEAALNDVKASAASGLFIRLYHTGLTPAVLGFYRALISAIPNWKTQGKSLVVAPMYFRGNDQFTEGKVWA